MPNPITTAEVMMYVVRVLKGDVMFLVVWIPDVVDVFLNFWWSGRYSARFGPGGRLAAFSPDIGVGETP